MPPGTERPASSRPSHTTEYLPGAAVARSIKLRTVRPVTSYTASRTREAADRSKRSVVRAGNGFGWLAYSRRPSGAGGRPVASGRPAPEAPNTVNVNAGDAATPPFAA